MKVLTTVKALQHQLKQPDKSPVGLVPTMGALHEGHLSLMKNAAADCPVIVVSIYVNPTQFNDKDDLRNYPRNLEKDLGMLATVLREDDIVFTPDDKEIYPQKDTRVFDFGNLDKVMEALHRPGHFNGVAQVVSRLFEIVKPDMAYFGIKDFQQVAVVRELVRQSGSGIRIVPNPIVREADGLAMSSRNQLLDPARRKEAPVIYRTISAASRMLRKNDIPEIKDFVKKEIERSGNFVLEYFEIVDDIELIPLKRKTEMKDSSKYYGCIAVRAGRIRLIDNIRILLV
ncbi:MAG TPA: pantoate--beta-alanine ligase [Bacteroidales bacterium]|jgi:pantoate--beta-alanine ligase|nr:pantoate--beta-alanine ligase [Bacteroidales bacterium]OQB59947.1 MAG: Pantothenate synthetase [Bacteroidetes bacterium ADurb.Bin145]HOU02074.1 pantoate--beta-alanine ligase [Bacteroidales bacterium]HQK68094.1 pantoate--beta-alanine ligase [Bacteroidales bacterium]